MKQSERLSAKEVLVKLIDQMKTMAAVIINCYRLNNRHSQETGEDSFNHDYRFLEKPNGLDAVRRKWHYWGIIDHSLMVLFNKTKAIGLTTKWGIWPAIQERLDEKIDGESKGDLLDIALLLHDLGKFAVRRMQWEGEKLIYRFSGHEKKSGEIIRSDFVAGKLKNYGLTMAQIEYIARLAECHYELSRVREDYSGEFNLEYVNSSVAQKKLAELKSANRDVDLEIGLIFVADTLGKGPYHAITMEEAETIADSGQVDPPEHLATIWQMPANIRVAERYFDLFK